MLQIMNQGNVLFKTEIDALNLNDVCG